MDNLQPHRSLSNPLQINSPKNLFHVSANFHSIEYHFRLAIVSPLSACISGKISTAILNEATHCSLARKIGLSPAPLGKPYARPARDRQGAYLSVKVALPDTARPSLAELLRRTCSLGKPVIVLAARGASVRAASVSGRYCAAPLIRSAHFEQQSASPQHLPSTRRPIFVRHLPVAARVI